MPLPGVEILISNRRTGILRPRVLSNTTGMLFGSVQSDGTALSANIGPTQVTSTSQFVQLLIDNDLQKGVKTDGSASTKVAYNAQYMEDQVFDLYASIGEGQVIVVGIVNEVESTKGDAFKKAFASKGIADQIIDLGNGNIHGLIVSITERSEKDVVTVNGSDDFGGGINTGIANIGAFVKRLIPSRRCVAYVAGNYMATNIVTQFGSGDTFIGSDATEYVCVYAGASKKYTITLKNTTESTARFANIGAFVGRVYATATTDAIYEFDRGAFIGGSEGYLTNGESLDSQAVIQLIDTISTNYIVPFRRQGNDSGYFLSIDTILSAANSDYNRLYKTRSQLVLARVVKTTLEQFIGKRVRTESGTNNLTEEQARRIEVTMNANIEGAFTIGEELVVSDILSRVPREQDVANKGLTASATVQLQPNVENASVTINASATVSI